MWLAIFIAACIIIAIFLYYNNNHLSISRYKLSIGESNPFRIVHLSDLHNKQFGRNNYKLYGKVKKLKPDLIAYTGDLIDDDAKNNGGKYVDATIEFLASLCGLCPVFYIYGNHEHRTGLAEYIKEKLISKGVHVLINAVEDINIKGNSLAILGLDEGQATLKSFYKERKKGSFSYVDNSIYFKELDAHQGIKLVLSHFPENFYNKDGYKYKEYNFHLQLSGHAHGGQFILPFFGGVFSPGQGIHPRFYKGVYGSGPYMIVSRGLGNSSFPFRLFNYPDIVAIDIN